MRQDNSGRARRPWMRIRSVDSKENTINNIFGFCRSEKNRAAGPAPTDLFPDISECFDDRLKKPGGYIRICSCGGYANGRPVAGQLDCAQEIANETQRKVCVCTVPAALAVDLTGQAPNMYCDCEPPSAWKCVDPVKQAK